MCNKYAIVNADTPYHTCTHRVLATNRTVQAPYHTALTITQYKSHTPGHYIKSTSTTTHAGLIITTHHTAT